MKKFEFSETEIDLILKLKRKIKRIKKIKNIFNNGRKNRQNNKS